MYGRNVILLLMYVSRMVTIDYTFGKFTKNTKEPIKGKTNVFLSIKIF